MNSAPERTLRRAAVWASRFSRHFEERATLAVVTTHLGKLKDFAYSHEGAENGSMAFDGESLSPLYRLEIGIPGTSHALDIAGRVGMPSELGRPSPRAARSAGSRPRGGHRPGAESALAGGGRQAAQRGVTRTGGRARSVNSM